MHPPMSNMKVHTNSDRTHKLQTHRESKSANVLEVQRHGDPHPDVGTPLHCRRGDGEVL